MNVEEQLVGCPVGEPVTLRCGVEAYPQPISYWQRNTKVEYKPVRKGCVINESYFFQARPENSEMIMESKNLYEIEHVSNKTSGSSPSFR